MKRTIRNAIARIDVLQDGQSISRGTGFLVSERLVLTALHVVANRRPDPPEPFPGTIMLQFLGHQTQAYIYEQFYDRSADWALLKCVAPPRCLPLPLAKLEADGAQWETYGFPDANPRDGMVQMGSLENHDAMLDGAHAFQLFSRQAAAGSGAPVKGLSGAPVIIDGAVVGLLRFALMKEGQTVAGTVYACSMAALIERAGDFLIVHNIDDWRARQQSRRRRRMAWYTGTAAVVVLFAVGAWVLLKQPAAPSVAVDAELNPRYMAILPFNAVGPQTDPTLAAGMDHALRGHFDNSPEIKVVSRASTARFVRDGGADIPEMGRQLKVGSVLEGNIEQKGENLVAEAWLVDVVSGEEIGRYRLIHNAQELFVLHSELAAAIAGKLGVELKDLARSRDSRAVEADPFVVRGDEFLDAAFENGADIRKILQPPETDLAIEQYQKALEISREPRTLARLSEAYSLKGLSGGHEFADLALDAWTQALADDPDLVEGYFARGLYAYWHKHDYESALWWFETTLNHEGGDRERVHYFAGLAARRLGKWTEALEHFNRAAEQDPLAWEKPFEYGRTSLLIRDYEEASKSFGYSREENADTPFPYLMQAMTLISWKNDVNGAQDVVREWILDHDVADLLEALMVTENRPIIRILDEGLRRALNQVKPTGVEGGESGSFLIAKAELCRGLGRTAEQRQHLERALSVLQTQQAEMDSMHYRDVLALVQAGLGNKPEALEAARQAAELRPISKDRHRGTVTSSLLTEVYITLDEHDLALQHLDLLLMNPSYLSVNWVHADPLFEPLRDDERFQQLLKQGSEVQE